MNNKAYSDELYNIFQASGRFSKKYYQTFAGTPHLFLSLLNFLHKNQGSERYAQTYKDLRDILNEYGVTGEAFEKSFFVFCPKGTEPKEGEEFNITVDKEATVAMENIKRDAIKNKRTAEVENLILELFSDKSYMINMIFTDIIQNEMKVAEMYDRIIQRFKIVVAQEIKELEDIKELTNLNKFLMNRKETTIDADEPVRKIEMALAGKSIRNVCLTGKAGTGKTQYVHEFVNRINNGKVPEKFKGKVVYELDTGSLVAGTRFRGDLEEKLSNILNIVKTHPEVIIFIDELHSFLNGGSGSEGGSQSCGQLLKPYLTRGEIQIIGATTAEEYTKYILPDKAFARRFTEVKIEEPDRNAVRKILEGLLPSESEYFNRQIQAELVDRVIDLSEKYSLDLANPSKAINMLELACAYAIVFEEKKETVDVDELIESIKLRYNLHIVDNKIEETKTELFKELLGQDDALNQVIRNMKIVDRNIVDTKKPLISMLFSGSTGTGKTQTARILAKTFFGSEENLIKINMGEYSTEQDVTKITGASQGYVGFDTDPELIKGVREKPSSVVLFDEIEKAHPSIQKVILNILDEGELTDNKGNPVSFRNTVIIFTTNLGCDKNTGKDTGIGLIKTKSTSGTETVVMKAIENFFSPEFLGRLDDIVFFKPLPESIIRTLIDRYLNEYKENSTDLNVEFTEEDYAEIVKNSDILSRGARGVRKAVRKQIVEVEERNEKAEVSA